VTPVPPVSPERLAAWRRDTPGCGGPEPRIHLNNAGSAFSPRPVLEAIFGHLTREQEIGGYEAADEAAGRLEETYADLARLLGGAPRNVAVVENATVAVAQALAAFDFVPGDVLVTTASDYPSNFILYEALARRRGLEVRVADDLPEGGVDPGSVRRLAADPRCRLVSVSWIPTNSGLVQDVEGVGEVCEALGVPYLIDACQAVGQLPVDPARLRCDYLGGTARKFLRGPRGLGFLWVSDRALARGDYPLDVDMRGADRTDFGFSLKDGARRFENWEFPYALVLGLGEAARYALAVGVAEAGERAAGLAAYVRERLAALPGAEVRDHGRRLCAIATVTFAGHDAAGLMHRLRERGINTSVAAGEDGSPIPAVRISPHYYNTREEVDALVTAVEDLLREEAR
jgi:selenocysteine lyase/cysteine desulfurase